MSRIIILALALILVAPGHADARWRHDTAKARAWLRTVLPAGQFRCIDRLWSRESGWRVLARNPYTGAYGIPQALPGKKMARNERPKRGKLWDDWRTDAMVQVTWGFYYIKGRYKRPCRALRFQKRNGWY